MQPRVAGDLCHDFVRDMKENENQLQFRGQKNIAVGKTG